MTRCHLLSPMYVERDNVSQSIPSLAWSEPSRVRCALQCVRTRRSRTRRWNTSHYANREWTASESELAAEVESSAA